MAGAPNIDLSQTTLFIDAHWRHEVSVTYIDIQKTSAHRHNGLMNT